jgi:hypothetical protein
MHRSTTVPFPKSSSLAWRGVRSQIAVSETEAPNIYANWYEVDKRWSQSDHATEPHLGIVAHALEAEEVAAAALRQL